MTNISEWGAVMRLARRAALVKRLRIIPDQNGMMYEDYEDVMQAADLIEQHEAFRQKVSDAVEMALKNYPPNFLREHLHQFIIPKPKPDPLVDVLLEMDLSSDPEEGQHDAKWLRIKLDALGFEIREKNDDRR